MVLFAYFASRRLKANSVESPHEETNSKVLKSSFNTYFFFIVFLFYLFHYSTRGKENLKKIYKNILPP